jgi:hypothetical protein
MKPDGWVAFEAEVNELADAFVKMAKCKYDYTPPHKVVRDLKIIDNALTSALQRLIPLNLEHVERQDISVSPFNFPVTSSLYVARSVYHSRKYGELTPHVPAYPSGLISGLRELRDVARMAIEMERPGRGNSPRRNSISARRMDLAKNFVFRYRARFSEMPPMTKTGYVVDLLQNMLNRAGEGDDADAGELLRQAIEADKVGFELQPKAKKANSVRRSK